MAKSKLIEINKKIEDSVVEGYKEIENFFVEGFQNMSNRFIDQYLTRDGESIEAAKERLNKEKNFVKQIHINTRNINNRLRFSKLINDKKL